MQSILPGKRAQPTHLLKFRNMAYGFDTPGPKALKQNVVRALDSSVNEKKRRKAEGKVEVTPKKKVKT